MNYGQIYSFVTVGSSCLLRNQVHRPLHYMPHEPELKADFSLMSQNINKYNVIHLGTELVILIKHCHSGHIIDGRIKGYIRLINLKKWIKIGAAIQMNEMASPNNYKKNRKVNQLKFAL